ncbi:MAG: response regulator transcription factor [Candidatus Dormibacteraeota bacterium]|nr:response regulator transcription factor [Candidatus Dormibacteraeota bacterium]MBV9524381.1 response regulator transcription factor [Candidatus Dormibacteraeota bacterium]
MATVLALDKDPLQLELLTVLLRRDGHRVLAAQDARTTMELLQQHSVDLVTVETAGQQDGVRLCQRLRQLNPWTPLMIVSEDGAEDHVVRGLTSAADDYITKPYAPRELLARVRALLRRSTLNRGSASHEDSIAIGEVKLDQQHMAVVVNGTRVSLTPRELSLLRAFMENPDRVLTRDQLMELAWGDGFVATRKAVDVYVLRLRKKIRPYLSGDFYVRSLRGFGYVFSGSLLRTLDTGVPQARPSAASAATVSGWTAGAGR